MGAESFREEMRAAGHDVLEWSNGPGDEYVAHAHAYRKILCCLEGSIVFHLPDRDVALSSGDRLVVDPGVVHSAVVGPSGARCAESHVL
ncbi:MAG: AraC family ligand binding domain-containing protein [Actinomycetota bacterium]|nr:AraC family ligand binding domain-containing protein [Actinomycetota bacterium]